MGGLIRHRGLGTARGPGTVGAEGLLEQCHTALARNGAPPSLGAHAAGFSLLGRGWRLGGLACEKEGRGVIRTAVNREQPAGRARLPPLPTSAPGSPRDPGCHGKRSVFGRNPASVAIVTRALAIQSGFPPRRPGHALSDSIYPPQPTSHSPEGVEVTGEESGEGTQLSGAAVERGDYSAGGLWRTDAAHAPGGSRRGVFLALRWETRM